MTKNKLNSTLPFDLIVVGGGAAGFFTAIVAAETNPTLKIDSVKVWSLDQ